MYFKTQKDSETGRKFDGLYVQKHEIDHANLCFLDKVGATTFIYYERYAAGGIIGVDKVAKSIVLKLSKVSTKLQRREIHKYKNLRNLQFCPAFVGLFLWPLCFLATFSVYFLKKFVLFVLFVFWMIYRVDYQTINYKYKLFYFCIIKIKTIQIYKNHFVASGMANYGQYKKYKQ